MEINAIFSISSIENSPIEFAFGYKNDLVTKNSTDLKNFKRLTSGHTLIMGRKTFESLGSKALPNRKMVVVSSMDVSDFKPQRGCFLARSLPEAINLASDEQAEKAFVIGGASLLRESFTVCDNIYMTFFNSKVPQNEDYVLLNVVPLMNKTRYKVISKKDFCEQCNVLGEDKKIEFRLFELRGLK